MSIPPKAWLIAWAVCAAGLHAAEPLAIQRLAGATFQVHDLEKTRHFYEAVLGYADAAASKDRALYRLNDEQYLEFQAGAPDNFRLLHVTMLTPDVDKLANGLRERGIALTREGDTITIQDPEHNRIRFLAGRKAEAQSGGFSSHLLHVGVNSDREAEAMALYRDALGFREIGRGGPSPAETRWIILNMPAAPGDWVEVMIARAQPPAMRQHICFEVTDTARAYQELTSRGLPANFRPFAAQNHRMIMNLRDPNGLRVEIMGEPTR